MVIPGWMIWFGRRPSSTAISASASRNLDFVPFLYSMLIFNRMSHYEIPEYLPSIDCDTEFPSQILKSSHLDLKSGAKPQIQTDQIWFLPYTHIVEEDLMAWRSIMS